MVTFHINKDQISSISEAMDNPNFDSYVGCILEETINGDEELMNKYISDKKLAPITIIQNDYDFTTELDKAFSMHQAVVQKFLIETVLEINSIHYLPLMMQAMGKIL